MTNSQSKIRGYSVRRALASCCMLAIMSATSLVEAAEETEETTLGATSENVVEPSVAEPPGPRVVTPRKTPGCADPELCTLEESELQRRYDSISDGGPIAMVVSGSILGSLALPTFLVAGAVSIFCANSAQMNDCTPAELTTAVSGVSTLLFGGLLIGGIVLLDENSENKTAIKNELGRRGRTTSRLMLQLQPVAFGSGLVLRGSF